MRIPKALWKCLDMNKCTQMGANRATFKRPRICVNCRCAASKIFKVIKFKERTEGDI